MKALLVKIAVTVAIVAFVASQIDAANVLARFGTLSVAAAIVAVLCGLMQIGLLAQRWVLVAGLQGLPLPFAEALRCIMASQFFSQGLPASVGGDALRIWWLSQLGWRLGPATQNVLLDRVAGLVALFVVNVIAIGLLVLALKLGRTAIDVALIIGIGIGVLALGASPLGRLLLVRAYMLLPLALRKRIRRVVRWFLDLHGAVATLLFTTAGFRVLLWGLAIHGFTVGICWVVVRDSGIPVTLVQLIAVIPPVLLVSYLPFSIGGWGVREGAMAFALALLGRPLEDGVFLGLSLGAFGLASALLGAVAWLVTPMPVSITGKRRSSEPER